jgi:hypothetical protein
VSFLLSKRQAITGSSIQMSTSLEDWQYVDKKMVVSEGFSVLDNKVSSEDHPENTPSDNNFGIPMTKSMKSLQVL